MHINRSSGIFLSIILIALIISTTASFYRYVVFKDFEYYLNEETVPDPLDSSSYKNL
jgi:hypothetical protein